MLLLNFDQDYLVCHETDVGLLLSTRLQLKQVLRSKEICLLEIEISIPKLERTLNSVPNFNLNRYLDRFYIWTPENALEHRQKVLDRFFQLIADQYESLIDVQRNIENIQILSSFLSQLLDPIMVQPS